MNVLPAALHLGAVVGGNNGRNVIEVRNRTTPFNRSLAVYHGSCVYRVFRGVNMVYHALRKPYF